MPNYVRYGVTPDNTDIIDVLTQIGKPALRVYALLKKHRDPHTNLVILPKPATPTETNIRNGGLRQLIDKDLVRRVRSHALTGDYGFKLKVPERTFILNPMFILPRTNENFDKIYDNWCQAEAS